ncbi:MAG TPA: AraC family transcriptional regulator [Verrucomicrobiales bacterium]|jgi:PAS domain S-box-containing protein|nr:AraC family transcriptional regulator [Verrucomicrobiales bacterium]
MPKKHKKRSGPSPSPVEAMRRELFAKVPGLAVMERLLDHAEDLVFCIKNRNGQYLSVNETFLRRTRLGSRNQLLGRTAREVFPALLAAGYEQQDAVVFKTGSEVHDRLETITHRDGTMGWYRADKVPVRDAGGTVIALAGISRDLHVPAAGDPKLGRLAAVVERIRTGYAQPLRVADLAVRAGLSISRMERLMQSVLGVSPRQLLTRQRVEAAAGLLRSTGKALGDIALECGFCDQPTFCRQFKSLTGISPGAYRRMSEE